MVPSAHFTCACPSPSHLGPTFGGFVGDRSVQTSHIVCRPMTCVQERCEVISYYRPSNDPEYNGICMVNTCVHSYKALPNNTNGMDLPARGYNIDCVCYNCNAAATNTIHQGPNSCSQNVVYLPQNIDPSGTRYHRTQGSVLVTPRPVPAPRHLHVSFA